MNIDELFEPSVPEYLVSHAVYVNMEYGCVNRVSK